MLHATREARKPKDEVICNATFLRQIYPSLADVAISSMFIWKCRVERPMQRERDVFREVREKYLDLALINLFDVMPSLFSWFCGELDIEGATMNRMWHSYLHDGRESDIEVSVNTPEGSTIVLIENKIDAEFQDGQVEAYYERGEAYISGSWDDFVVCLVAPNQYISSSIKADEFEFVVLYEDILEQVEQADINTSLSFEPLFRGAIEDSESPYDREINDEKTQFLHHCWRLAGEHYPCVQPEDKPDSAGKNAWFRINPPSLNDGRLNFKLKKGHIDLELRKSHYDFEAVSALASDYDEFCAVDDSRLRSYILRGKVSAILDFSEPGDYTNVILAGLEKANRLRDIYLEEIIER